MTKKKDYLRIIGDVHGCITKGRLVSALRTPNYMDIVKDVEYSVQLGDMGFRYKDLNVLDAEHHVFFGGNHDNYDSIHGSPNDLGDYGEHCIGGLPFYFVRGAFSIDKKWRKAQRSKCWWEEEELTYAQGMSALTDYEKARPRLMITHTCPTEIARLMGNPSILRAFNFNPKTFNTSTQSLLQAMFEIHKPELWCYGHFHKNWTKEVGGTNFNCIGELDWVTLNKKGEIS